MTRQVSPEQRIHAEWIIQLAKAHMVLLEAHEEHGIIVMKPYRISGPKGIELIEIHHDFSKFRVVYTHMLDDNKLDNYFDLVNASPSTYSWRAKTGANIGGYMDVVYTVENVLRLLKMLHVI